MLDWSAKFGNIARVPALNHVNVNQGIAMRTQLIWRTAKFCAAVVILRMALMPDGISLAQTKTSAPPDFHMCALLTAQDVEPIVGVRPVSRETKGGTTCIWGDPGNDPNKPRLMIQAPEFTRGTNDPILGGSTPVHGRLDASFKANRTQAFSDKSAHAKNEPQLGKTAYSALTDYGAQIVILRNKALLNIQYMTGKPGTPEDVETIRKLAAKVAASF